jgi:succinate-acetate transporter protein
MQHNGALHPTVFLRPVGSSLPLGLSGLGIASLVWSGLDLGWIAAAQGHDAARLILAAAVPLQLLSCLFALMSRDGAAAGALALLASGWISTGVIHLTSPPGTTGDALGLGLLAVGLLLFVSIPAQALSKPLPALAFGLASIRFLLAGLYQLSGATGWQHASGALGLAVALVAAYAVLAFELEDAQSRAVLPTFRRGRGMRSTSGPAEDQLMGLEHEPGVRQQL